MYNSANFFASHDKHDGTGRHAKGPVPSTIRNFSLVYAGISILTLVWGLFNYHRRLHLIRTKYAGNFGEKTLVQAIPNFIEGSLRLLICRRPHRAASHLLGPFYRCAAQFYHSRRVQPLSDWVVRRLN